MARFVLAQGMHDRHHASPGERFEIARQAIFCLVNLTISTRDSASIKVSVIAASALSGGVGGGGGLDDRNV